MGSSVWHGGFSTFMAISVLAPSQTYIFVVFYRLWFGIILFGMANGFLLLPVILSFVGPIHPVVDPALFEGKPPDIDARSASDEAEVEEEIEMAEHDNT